MSHIVSSRLVGIELAAEQAEGLAQRPHPVTAARLEATLRGLDVVLDESDLATLRPGSGR